MNKNQPGNRPAAFDARVMAYYPGLRRLAARHVPLAYREDLVTDTVISALENWGKFRETGGMWSWLEWTMRGIVTNAAKKAATRDKHVRFVPLEEYHDASVAPAQEGYTCLSETLRQVSAHRHGSVLIRRAMGDKLKDIANDRGTSVEWVRQMEAGARAELRAAA